MACSMMATVTHFWTPSDATIKPTPTSYKPPLRLASNMYFTSFKRIISHGTKDISNTTLSITAVQCSEEYQEYISLGLFFSN